MLTTIRNKATSWVAKILFGILIVAFGAWGIGDIFTGQDLGEPVLTVGKADYTAQEFRRDLERPGPGALDALERAAWSNCNARA